MERLLGTYGTAPAERLGLDPFASDDEIRSALSATLDRWQRRAESPLSSTARAAAARTLVRTCEGMLLQLDGQAPA